MEPFSFHYFLVSLLNFHQIPWWNWQCFFSNFNIHWVLTLLTVFWVLNNFNSRRLMICMLSDMQLSDICDCQYMIIHCKDYNTTHIRIWESFIMFKSPVLKAQNNEKKNSARAKYANMQQLKNNSNDGEKSSHFTYFSCSSMTQN